MVRRRKDMLHSHQLAGAAGRFHSLGLWTNSNHMFGEIFSQGSLEFPNGGRIESDPMTDECHLACSKPQRRRLRVLSPQTLQAAFLKWLSSASWSSLHSRIWLPHVRHPLITCEFLHLPRNSHLTGYLVICSH